MKGDEALKKGMPTAPQITRNAVVKAVRRTLRSA